MRSILLLLTCITFELNAQIKDEYFYQTDSTYSHKFIIKAENSENNRLSINHKQRPLHIDFEFSEMLSEMEIDKNIIIELWRKNELIESFTSNYNTISTCGLLPKDSIWINVKYTLKNPWLEKPSKTYSSTKHFIINEIKDYNSNDFYLEFLKIYNEQITELTINDLKTYKNGKVLDHQQNFKGNRLYIPQIPDSISFNLSTKFNNKESIVLTNVPKYGGRFFYGETNYNAQTIDLLKKFEKGNGVFKIHENPHLILDLNNYKHKVTYLTTIERCSNSYTSLIHYLDKNEKIFKTIKTISINK